MRLISVVMGVESSDLRSKDTTTLLNHGFNTYKIDIILNKDKVLGNSKIVGGVEEESDIVLIKDATILNKINANAEEYKISLNINKIKAPVKKGDVVGTVEIMDNNGKLILEENVTVNKNIKKANFFNYLKRNIKTITSGI